MEMLKEIVRRIKLIFGTGEVTRVETNSVQIKMATGITNDKIQRPHNYGFMSRPLPKSKAYTLFIGGDVSRGIAVIIEDKRYQMNLQPGEVAMLDDKGNLIHLTSVGIKIKTAQTVDIEAGENVNISCKNATIDATKTTINSVTEINGETTINADTTITGMCKVGSLSSATGGSVAVTGGLKVDNSEYTQHTHTESDGSQTSTPNN